MPLSGRESKENSPAESQTLLHGRLSGQIPPLGFTQTPPATVHLFPPVPGRDSPGVNQRKTRPQSLKRSSTGGFQGESRPQGSTHGFREQFVFQKGRRKNHKTDLRRLRRPEPPHAVSGCDYVQSQSSPLSLASISASLPRLRLSPGSKAGNGAGCTKEYLRESR